MISFATNQQVKEYEPIINELRHKYLNTLDMIGDDLLGDYKAFELPHIINAVKKHGGKKVLDFGTGASCLPAYLNSLGYEVWCLDDGSWHPEINEKNYNEVYGCNVRYIVDDIVRHSDCIPDDFDVIYSVSVLEHVNENEKYIEALNKKLKKGGISVHVMDCFVPEDVYQPEEGMGRLIISHAN